LEFVNAEVLGARICSDPVDEIVGGGIAAQNGGVEQIDAQVIRVLMCAPGCLACPARSEKIRSDRAPQIRRRGMKSTATDNMAMRSRN
jgi:hypothetical protein